MPPKFVIVDDDVDLGSALADWIEDSSGRPCIVAQSLEQLQGAQEAVIGCGLALVDINLGSDQPSGLDVAHWLREIGFRGEIVFFTGHASNHPLVRLAAVEQDAVILKKPLDFHRLEAIVSAHA